mmetsp:Transcript_21359/g.59389  ORF Transcript_21359/g.59389 Transcript_21359/m.59389 type:complete len:234 (-) Transcript_21359:535-1236(-)
MRREDGPYSAKFTPLVLPYSLCSTILVLYRPISVTMASSGTTIPLWVDVWIPTCSCAYSLAQLGRPQLYRSASCGFFVARYSINASSSGRMWQRKSIAGAVSTITPLLSNQWRTDRSSMRSPFMSPCNLGATLTATPSLIATNAGISRSASSRGNALRANSASISMVDLPPLRTKTVPRAASLAANFSRYKSNDAEPSDSESTKCNTTARGGSRFDRSPRPAAFSTRTGCNCR